MAENNAYHIYVHLNEFENQSAVAGTANSSKNTESSSGGEITARQALKTTKRIVALTGAASIADKYVSYRISQVNLRTGASELEQRQAEAYSAAKGIVGAALALGGGFVFGGPAGLAMATIGVITSGINKAINIAQKEKTLNAERSLENITHGLMNLRAGVNGRRSGDQ